MFTPAIDEIVNTPVSMRLRMAQVIGKATEIAAKSAMLRFGKKSAMNAKYAMARGRSRTSKPERNAEGRMQKAEVSAFCFLHSAFVMTSTNNMKSPAANSVSVSTLFA